MTSPLASAPSSAAPGPIASHLGTEFGRVLAELVATVPGALGAVLSDRDGHAVDFAVDPAHYDALDIQIAGAQLGQPLVRTYDGSVRHLIDPSIDRSIAPSNGSASVLVEAERCALLGAVVEPKERAVLVLVLAQHASLGRALVRFDRAARTIALLLA